MYYSCDCCRTVFRYISISRDGLHRDPDFCPECRSKGIRKATISEIQREEAAIRRLNSLSSFFSSQDLVQ